MAEDMVDLELNLNRAISFNCSELAGFFGHRSALHWVHTYIV